LGVAVWVGLFVRDTLKAAQKANRIVRRSARREQRAYLSVSPKVIYNFDQPGGIRIECEIKNHGQTPAFELNHTFDIAVFPEDLPEDFSFPLPSHPIRRNSAVFPNSEIKTWFNRPALSPAEISSIEARTHNLYVWGKSTYRDAFGRRRWTKFNARLDLFTFLYHLAEIRAERVSPGFSWAFGDRHNQAT